MVDWEELKAKNKLEDNRARKIMEEVEQTQKRAQEVSISIPRHKTTSPTP